MPRDRAMAVSNIICPAVMHSYTAYKSTAETHSRRCDTAAYQSASSCQVMRVASVALCLACAESLLYTQYRCLVLTVTSIAAIAVAASAAVRTAAAATTAAARHLRTKLQSLHEAQLLVKKVTSLTCAASNHERRADFCSPCALSVHYTLWDALSVKLCCLRVCTHKTVEAVAAKQTPSQSAHTCSVTGPLGPTVSELVSVSIGRPFEVVITCASREVA
eukprot:9894-Heterococcus_DN1.PRE.3